MWVTCLELARALKSARGDDGQTPALPDVLAQLVARRVRGAPRASPAGPDLSDDPRDSLEALVCAVYELDRCLLIVDGWDECPAASQRRVREALDQAHGPLHTLVLTRPLEADTARFAGAEYWQLLSLRGREGDDVARLVRSWFEEKEAGPRLIDYLRRQPSLLELARVPMFGTLICWAWNAWISRLGDRQAPNPARLLLDVLEAYTRLLPRGHAPGGQDEAGRVVTALGRLALRAPDVARWLVRRRAASDRPGSRIVVRARQLELLVHGGRGRLKLLHEAFAPALAADAAVRRAGSDPAWFDRLVAERFNDPR